MHILLQIAYAVGCYLGALALYRLFFHPLRKYPGPVLAALTEGYEVYYNIIQFGGMVDELLRLHTIYGTSNSCCLPRRTTTKYNRFFRFLQVPSLGLARIR